MKRKMMFNCSMVLFFLILALYTSLELYAYRQHIYLQQQLLAGELPQAEQLKVNLALGNRRGGFRWQTTFPLRPEPQPETEYLNQPNPIYAYQLFFYPGFQPLLETISVEWNRHQRGLDGDSKEHAFKLWKDWLGQDLSFYMDIVEEMTASHERERIIKLKDYMEYMPFYLSANPQLRDTGLAETDFWQSEHILPGSVLKFPIREELKLNIKLDYLEDEPYSRVICSSEVLGSTIEDYVYSLSAWKQRDNKILFAFVPGDYPLPADKYGIYEMPLTKKSGYHYGEERYFFAGDKIKKVYSLQAKQDLKDMFYDKDGELCLVVKQAGKEQLQFFDDQQFSLLGCMDLENQGKGILDSSSQVNGILILYEDGELKWIDPEQRKVVFQSKLDLDSLLKLKWNSRIYQNKVAYEKGKLYLTFLVDRWFYLVVLDEEGQQSLVKYSFPMFINKNSEEGGQEERKAHYSLHDLSISLE